MIVSFLCSVAHCLTFFPLDCLVLFVCACSIVFVIMFVWDLSSVSCFVFSFCVFVFIPFNAITSNLWSLGSLTSVGPEPLEWKC